MQTQLMSIKDYVKNRFVQGSAPDPRTLQKLIDCQELAGKKLGKQYYIEVDSTGAEIDPRLKELMIHG